MTRRLTPGFSFAASRGLELWLPRIIIKAEQTYSNEVARISLPGGSWSGINRRLFYRSHGIHEGTKIKCDPREADRFRQHFFNQFPADLWHYLLDYILELPVWPLSWRFTLNCPEVRYLEKPVEELSVSKDRLTPVHAVHYFWPNFAE